MCRRGNALVVVEVKTRSGQGYGAPQEALDSRKRQALIRAAAEYRVLAEWRGPIRFALVGVKVGRDGGLDLELTEDPFD